MQVMRRLGLYLAMLATAACTRSSESQTNAELINPVNNLPRSISSMADWLKIKQARIQATATYLESLKTVYTALGDAPTDSVAGFRLQGRSSQFGRIMDEAALEQEAKRLQNAGAAIQNYDVMLNAEGNYAKKMAEIAQMYASISNTGPKNFLDNQRSWLGNERLSVDNEGARIENFGKTLENYSKGLDNVLKELDVVLKGYYAVGYRSYVDSYLEYSDQIQKVWKQIGRTSAQVGGAMRELNKYRRQSNICEARRQRILSLKYRAANREASMKDVNLRRIPEIFNHLASSIEGEACLHKVLLTSKFDNMDELYKIEYEVAFTDKKVSVDCPVTSTPEGIAGRLATRYPWPIVNTETFEFEGYFHPVTYYQMYRVLTSVQAPIQIASAAINENGGGCNPFHPVSEEYMFNSVELEQSLADTYETVRPSPSGATEGFSANYSNIPASNRSYRKMMDRVTKIFSTVEQCIETARSGPPVLDEPSDTPTDPTTLPPLPLPWEAGQKARSDMNTYFDADFPLMSESIRECAKTAEHFRYRAFAQLETAQAMFEVLQKAAVIPPPRSPHPVQYQPGPPQTRNGNDF